MAVDFAPNAYVHSGSAILSAVPISMVARVRPDASGASADNVICCINRAPGQGFVDSQHWSFETRGSGGDNYVLAIQLGPGVFPPTTNEATTPIGSLNLGAWNSCVAVFAANNLINVYCNSTSGTASISATVPTVGDTQIGARIIDIGGTTFRPMNGCLADVGIFNVALNGAQIARYLAGYAGDDLGITPVMYLPMVAAATVNDNTIGADLTKVVGAGNFVDCSSSPPSPTPSLVGGNRRWLAGLGPIQVLTAIVPPAFLGGYLGGFLDGFLGTYL